MTNRRRLFCEGEGLGYTYTDEAKEISRCVYKALNEIIETKINEVDAVDLLNVIMSEVNALDLDIKLNLLTNLK